MNNPEVLKDIRYVLRNVPIIYQYSSFEGAKALLENSTLLIKNPSIFNDPYDCDLDLIKFDSTSNFQLEKAIENFNKKRKSKEPKSTSDFSNLTKEEITNTFKNVVFPAYSKKIAVTCFSELYNNMLMWSHYTYSHKGICIGFKLTELYKDLSAKHPNLLSMIRVNYTNQYEQKDYFEDIHSSLYHWIRTKSEDWAYEKEIRFLFINQELDTNLSKLVKFEREVISEIFLGSKMDKAEQNFFIEYCKNFLPDAKIYKMRKQTKTFNLIPELIE